MVRNTNITEEVLQKAAEIALEMKAEVISENPTITEKEFADLFIIQWISYMNEVINEGREVLAAEELRELNSALMKIGSDVSRGAVVRK
jgi:hypothetical protein